MHTPGNQQPARVLVVEDDWLIREMLADVLEDAGFVTVLSASAREALQQLRQDGHFDLVVTDVEMPGLMDGIDLARVVAAQRPEIGVLIVSGRNSGPLPADVHFLAKPFTPTDLFHALRKVAPELGVSVVS